MKSETDQSSIATDVEESKRNIFLNQCDFARELLDVWRVVVAFVLVQISAGCAAVIFARFGSWIVDFWFGGAVSSIFGYCLGLFWQTSAVKGSWQKHRPILLALGILGLAMFIAAFFMPLAEMAEDL